MARTIAKWMNEEGTKGAMLSSDGTLSIMHRENMGQMWSPPVVLDLTEATGDMSSVLPDIPDDKMMDWRWID